MFFSPLPIIATAKRLQKQIVSKETVVLCQPASETLSQRWWGTGEWEWSIGYGKREGGSPCHSKINLKLIRQITFPPSQGGKIVLHAKTMSV